MKISDALGDFRNEPLDKLIERMSHYGENDSRFRTLKAELDTRVAVKQIRAAEAQVRSAWFQLAAVIAALLAALATLIAPHISN